MISVHTVYLPSLQHINTLNYVFFKNIWCLTSKIIHLINSGYYFVSYNISSFIFHSTLNMLGIRIKPEIRPQSSQSLYSKAKR